MKIRHTHDCKKYFSKAKISEREIKSNIEKTIANLGEVNSITFLALAYSVLEESVENLFISIQEGDIESCIQQAHKLRGSSNLYASKALIETLLDVVEQPSLAINNTDKYETLECEFKLVLTILKETSCNNS